MVHDLIMSAIKKSGVKFIYFTDGERLVVVKDEYRDIPYNELEMRILAHELRHRGEEMIISVRVTKDIYHEGQKVLLEGTVVPVKLVFDGPDIKHVVARVQGKDVIIPTADAEVVGY